MDLENFIFASMLCLVFYDKSQNINKKFLGESLAEIDHLTLVSFVLLV